MTQSVALAMVVVLVVVVIVVVAVAVVVVVVVGFAGLLQCALHASLSSIRLWLWRLLLPMRATFVAVGLLASIADIPCRLPTTLRSGSRFGVP